MGFTCFTFNFENVAGENSCAKTLLNFFLQSSHLCYHIIESVIDVSLFNCGKEPKIFFASYTTF